MAAAAGGFFGSGGKSQESETTTETTGATSQSYAEQGSQQFSGLAAGSGGALASPSSSALAGVTVKGGGTLSLSDQGSIGQAFEFAKTALGFAGGAQQSLSAGYQDLSHQLSAQTDKVAKAFAEEKQLSGAVNVQQVLFALIGAGALTFGVYWIFGKR